MAISIDNIEKRKQLLEKSAPLEPSGQKVRVLRPWESFEREPDLLELVKSKKTKERVCKKKYGEVPKPKVEKSKAVDPQERLKEISKKYFGDLI